MSEKTTDQQREVLKKISEALPEKVDGEDIAMILSWILTKYGTTLDETHSILLHVAGHQRYLEELNNAVRKQPTLN